MNEIVDFDFLCAHMNVCAWVQTASIWNSNAQMFIYLNKW